MIEAPTGPCGPKSHPLNDHDRTPSGSRPYPRAKRKLQSTRARHPDCLLTTTIYFTTEPNGEAPHGSSLEPRPYQATYRRPKCWKEKRLRGMRVCPFRRTATEALEEGRATIAIFRRNWLKDHGTGNGGVFPRFAAALPSYFGGSEFRGWQTTEVSEGNSAELHDRVSDPTRPDDHERCLKEIPRAPRT